MSARSDLLRLWGLDYSESVGLFGSLKDMFVIILGLSRRDAPQSKRMVRKGRMHAKHVEATWGCRRLSLSRA
jgi:hypothetical protein